jgi:hypothetical protein
VIDFELPPAISDLVAARNRLKQHYSSANLSFTLDGNLVGDIGEAIVAGLFGVKLVARNGTGIDGHAKDGRSVQVKTTGTFRGPAFRMVDTRADHLLFLELDLERFRGSVIFNGPESIALAKLPKIWTGQRSLTPSQIRAADRMVPDADRLPICRPADPYHSPQVLL